VVAAPVIPESATSTESVAQDEPKVEDVGKVQPEMYVCFGTIDEGHPECQKCQFNEECAAKAAGK